jgi:hypothetical protein
MSMLQSTCATYVEGVSTWNFKEVYLRGEAMGPAMCGGEKITFPQIHVDMKPNIHHESTHDNKSNCANGIKNRASEMTYLFEQLGGGNGLWVKVFMEIK